MQTSNAPDSAVRIVRVDRSSDRVLRNLFEHYLHDMAEWFEFDAEEDGSYAYPTQDVWAEGCDVFIAYSGKTPIGFALVGDAGSRVPGASARDLKEFFVVRRHRRGGIGTAFARHVWEQYPGPWLVRVFYGNRPAVPFWRTVIDEYTGGRFHEQERVGDDGRVWLYFTFGNGTHSRHPEASLEP